MGFLQSANWHRARRQALHRADYTCQRCGVSVLGHRQSQVHHRAPRDRAPALLVEPQNLEVLCRKCHRIAHNRGDLLAPAAPMACTLDGTPTDAWHPWNTPRNNRGGSLEIGSPPPAQRPALSNAHHSDQTNFRCGMPSWPVWRPEMIARKRDALRPNLDLTGADWSKIAAALPPYRTGRPPSNDRELMAAFCYCRATDVAWECMPTSFTVKASALRVRVQRWR